MSSMDGKKKFLMWTILLIAMVQMPSLALTPGINQIQTTVFTDQSLSTIQTTMQIPNLISPFVTIITAFIIGKGWVTKKVFIVAGLFLVALTGVLALFFHTEFWHLCMLSCCLGLGLSGYISTASSLLVDHFTLEQRQTISGYQTSFVNGGGILMSLCGGLLATMMWYGGYLMLLLALPVAVIGIFSIPNVRVEKKVDASGRKKGIKLHPDVFLFGSFIFVFMLVYNVIGSNLSTHIAGIGDTSVSGYATAVQMGGGVVCGLFFGKISRKLGDFVTGCAFLAIFVGMTILSLFQNSLPMIFIGVFISGTAMSMMLPQCLYSVSKVVDDSSSAIATAITSCICPGLGGFFSAMVFTNITTALFGESTVARYRFVSFVALACAAIIFVIMTVRRKRERVADR